MNSLIKATELLKIKNQNNLCIIEVGKHSVFEENHLENAIFMDLDTDLAKIEEDFANGGRHPLPEFETFLSFLGEKGITPDTHLVVYDRYACAMGAARFWWMMRSVGHSKIQVLDGGFSAIERIGFPKEKTERLIIKNKAYPTTAKNWLLKYLDLNAVKEGVEQESLLLVDVRSSERFQGINEPIDLIAGHIPTAINLAFSEHLNSDSEYISHESLKEKYHFLTQQEKEVVVYCGSGVSACHLLLAMESAQLPIPAIYMGSWSEWSRQ